MKSGAHDMITKEKKLWLLFFVEAAIILFIIYQITVGLHPKPTLDHLNSNFKVSIPVEQINRLYETNDRGWFGDGDRYSVWQCQDDAPFITQASEWHQGQAFQQDLFTLVKDRLQPDGYFLPRELQQEDCFYLIAEDAEGYGDDQVLLIYTPQVKLGDGLYYKNLLFVIEWYS